MIEDTPASTNLRLGEPFRYYSTRFGTLYLGSAEETLGLPELRKLRKKIKLIFTSPPFPLNTTKAYGNLQRAMYRLWLASMGQQLGDFLHPKGSIVIEIGNAWTPGLPTFSTLPLESLLEFKNGGEFQLCEEFICFNPAKLPTPAHWVTIKRIRVKDAFTRLWWMSRSAFPDARNTRVLQPYSKDMQQLLERGTYNHGDRPSEHRIRATSFLNRHRGSIPPNVFVVGGTASRDTYLAYCKRNHLGIHPARMPIEVARFFVKFLTREGDYVLDPFAGSNVTGAAAESLGRHWVSIEPQLGYAKGSVGRFSDVRFNKTTRPRGPAG